MRRILAGLVAVAVVVALAAAIVNHSTAARGYRVDAVFDTAKGIVGGQLVKVAGARVGSVTGVALTRHYQARIEMQIDSRFAPFHADASCTIKPEGLIAENFVQCDPGTPGTALLATQGGTPTVPVGHTSVPVSLNDLFDIWDVPTSDRLTLLVNDLGAGLTGQGQDINAILRRSNPALTEADQALSVLNSQQQQLSTALHSTDVAVAALSNRAPEVTGFISHAADVARETAAHRGQLAAAIRQLPPLLGAARPALSQLDAVTQAGLPVLANLDASAPGLNRLVNEVQPLSQAALPTLGQLTAPLASARSSVATLTPVGGQLQQFAADAGPASQLLDQLFVSLRNSGYVEGLLGFLYLGASSTSRYDATSHLLAGHFQANGCSVFATTPTAGCSADFTQPATGQSPAAARRRTRTHATTGHPATPTTSPSAGKPTGALPSGVVPTPTLPPALQQLLNHLPSLPSAPKLPGGASLPIGATGATGPTGAGQGGSAGVSTLLNYLLK